MYSTLGVICLLLGVTLFWRDSLRARETAARASKRACKSYSLQFLDDTVALRHLRVCQHRGKLAFKRVYEFEYSASGVERTRASVTLRGADVESLYLPIASEADAP